MKQLLGIFACILLVSCEKTIQVPHSIGYYGDCARELDYTLEEEEQHLIGRWKWEYVEGYNISTESDDIRAFIKDRYLLFKENHDLELHANGEIYNDAKWNILELENGSKMLETTPFQKWNIGGYFIMCENELLLYNVQNLDSNWNHYLKKS